ncbi:hypothetical protein ACFWOL_28045 [Streptomyces sp. NPDC058442]|uniref:hypothetical protein n=1 Tax=Streptomyces sp. NPDC058442 TaxID=3346503 RepID=UPI0036573F10
MYTIFVGTSLGERESEDEQQPPEAVASAQNPEPSATQPSPSKPNVRWSGEFVAVYERTDMDSVPPSRTYYDGGDLNASWGRPKGSTVIAYFAHDAQGVKLDPGMKASPDVCVARAATHAVETLNVEAGTRFCLVTNGGRSAVVEVKSVDLAGDEFTAQATVWEK